MKIRANQLSSHLKNSLAPCYLVTGDEHLLVAEALDDIRKAAIERGFGNRELHVATTGFDWNQLTASTGNMSLFAEQRIVELRLPTGKPGRVGGQAIVDLAGQAGPELLFIVTGPKLDAGAAKSKWAKTLEQKGVSLAVWPIGLRELPGWIASRMRKAGLQPDREAVSMIVDRVEGNLLAAGQEIEKLRLLLGEGRVTARDVEDAVANSSRYDVYKLTDAAMAGDAPRAVKILGGLRSEGVEPVIVMWALTRELRSLATLDDAIRQGTDLGSAMRAARVWNSRQGLVRSCIGRHQRGAFHRMLKASGRADAAAKGQRYGDPWQMAADIVIGMARA
ncbi:MAG: DNA polymerase III subunit delta [Gammaproteobacteria bacterium]|nr:DNA polymerase III subunit delta [Gammaproteobacteria bacterium]NNF49708.1 DNA polymerase III subunit delta [Woeseiaceae bacterium]MBT8093993.1 DNA polymerase III subunit delta [Gammaproteobacteria bacterium]MBT8105272.1 DNA polymerase III subunit delta [Gammaproteobacteria bacterium]NNK25286.1 DNA polymerase III subunit delta [Woeseiaceae bacterium]